LNDEFFRRKRLHKVRRMTIFNPDTYCGIYCGACSIAMYSKTGRADEFVACLGGVPKEELSCGGCKSDNIYAGCKACGLRRCAREKALVMPRLRHVFFMVRYSMLQVRPQLSVQSARVIRLEKTPMPFHAHCGVPKRKGGRQNCLTIACLSPLFLYLFGMLSRRL